jgi:hypothetical protein
MSVGPTKLVFLIQPCPWCRKTPKLVIPETSDYYKDKGPITWLAIIQCENRSCPVRPKSQYVSIHKTSQTLLWRFMLKLEKLVHSWNMGNPFQAIESSELDIGRMDFK